MGHAKPEELETFAAGGGLPDPVPNRPSNLDTMDQKSLINLEGFTGNRHRAPKPLLFPGPFPDLPPHGFADPLVRFGCQSVLLAHQ